MGIGRGCKEHPGSFTDLVGDRNAPDGLATLGVVAADGGVGHLQPAGVPAVAGLVVHQRGTPLGKPRHVVGWYGGDLFLRRHSLLLWGGLGWVGVVVVYGVNV